MKLSLAGIEALARPAAASVGIPWELLAGLVLHESGGDTAVVSHAGAIGLAQLMPATARELGVDPWDPVQNIHGGARYLADRLREFRGDTVAALTAYHSGASRVRRAGWPASGWLLTGVIGPVGRAYAARVAAAAGKFGGRPVGVAAQGPPADAVGLVAVGGLILVAAMLSWRW